jgi:hypothetical protein
VILEERGQLRLLPYSFAMLQQFCLLTCTFNRNVAGLNTSFIICCYFAGVNIHNFKNYFNMRPRRIENKDELLSGSDKKERRYIKDIMMSYGIFDRENNGIISAMFSSINSCNISNPSIA